MKNQGRAYLKSRRERCLPQVFNRNFEVTFLCVFFISRKRSWVVSCECTLEWPIASCTTFFRAHAGEKVKSSEKRSGSFLCWLSERRRKKSYSFALCYCHMPCPIENQKKKKVSQSASATKNCPWIARSMAPAWWSVHTRGKVIISDARGTRSASTVDLALPGPGLFSSVSCIPSRS